MSKTPLFAIALATFGLAGVPAFASTSPATGSAQTLMYSDHGSKQAGIVVAQSDENPATSDEGKEDSNKEEK